jgi:hypothetical protein
MKKTKGQKLGKVMYPFYEHDEEGRETYMELKDGTWWKYTYGHKDNQFPTRLEMSTGHWVESEYNEDHKLTKSTNPDGWTTQEWDGEVIQSLKNSYGDAYTYQFDEYKNIIRLTHNNKKTKENFWYECEWIDGAILNRYEDSTGCRWNRKSKIDCPFEIDNYIYHFRKSHSFHKK